MDNNQATELATLGNQSIEVSTISESTINLDQAPPTLEERQSLSTMEPAFSLNMKYKTADDWAEIRGKEIRAFFMGTKLIPNDKNELVNCGVFFAQKECFISGPMLLMEAVKNLPLKTPVAITYIGKKPNKNSEGATMQFSVEVLN